MSFRDVTGTIRALADPRQVGYLIAYVTNRCNFRCEFCFYFDEIEKGKKTDELTVEEFEKIGRKLGPLAQLSLTGGEPFLRKDFLHVAQVLIRHTHARWVTIPTNGWYTDRIKATMESLLEEFPDSNFRLMFSVEGIGDKHDMLRSMPGSFEAIRKSYAVANRLRRQYPNIVVDANTVYSDDSRHTVVDTLKAIDQEFFFDNLSITYTRGVIKDPALRTDDQQHYVQARDYIMRRARSTENRFLSSVWRAVDDVSHDRFADTVFNEQFVSTCVSGRKLVVLSETGDVFPCEILDRKLGNIRDHGYDMRTLLGNNASKAVRKQIKQTQCSCSFECAHAASTVWNVGHYPQIVTATLDNMLRTFGAGQSKMTR